MGTFLSFKNCSFSPYLFFPLVTIISYFVFFCYPRCPEPKFIHLPPSPIFLCSVGSQLLSTVLLSGNCSGKVINVFSNVTANVAVSIITFRTLFLDSCYYPVSSFLWKCWFLLLEWHLSTVLCPLFACPISFPAPSCVLGSPSAAHSSSSLCFLLF